MSDGTARAHAAAKARMWTNKAVRRILATELTLHHRECPSSRSGVFQPGNNGFSESSSTRGKTRAN
jgi:hypothetical protein